MHDPVNPQLPILNQQPSVRPASLDFLTHSSTQHENSVGVEPSLTRADAGAIALLVGSMLGMFWRVAFTSAMFFYRDVFNYTYPCARFIHEVCREGHLPYWNPYLNYGQPLLANPNFLFFYPFTLLIILLPVDVAYTMHYLAHFVLAAIGAYCLARRWQQSRAAAFFAAFVFAFSGPVLSLGNFYNHAACAAWIPWALLLTDYALEKRSLRPWIVLVLVFTLQFLAGEPFTLLATFFLSGAYAFYRSGHLRVPAAQSRRQILAAFILIGFLVLALGAVQLFPSLDLLHYARRGAAGLPFNETTYWSFHPLSLLEVLLPNFFGPAFEAPTLWRTVLGCRNMPYFASVFVGFVPLFFAFVGWALGRDDRRNFVAPAALALLLLSFGRFAPIFAEAYLLVPPLELVRFPVKLLVPTILLTALLAGWGVDALRRLDFVLSLSRPQILAPLKCLGACVVLLWMVSLLAPRWITAPSAWILLRTHEMFLPTLAGQLSSAQVTDATNYFLAMLRLYFPGLAGFFLGGVVWLVGLDRGKVWARRALSAAALLGIAQLVLVNYSANPTVSKSFYTYRPPVVAQIQSPSQPYRFCSILRDPASTLRPPAAQEYLNFEAIPEAAAFSPLAQVAFRDRLILARGSMLTSVETSQNTDLEGSLPPSLHEFWIYALRQSHDPARADCLLGRTNVKYLIRRAHQPTATSRQVAEIFNGSSQPSYLDQEACFVPRAYVAGSAVYSTSAVETLSHLADPDFDPREDVILNDGAPDFPTSPGQVSPARAPTSRDATGPARSAASTAPPVAGDCAIAAFESASSDEVQNAGLASSAGRVEIVDRQPNTVTLQAELLRPAYVVLLDRFDPNWHATVDGWATPILRANHMFRAVRVSAGKHLIRFYYRQRGLRAGGLLSFFTLLLLVTVWTLDRPAQRVATIAAD